jgi:DNA-binding MarR family transcriptional regulator
MSRLLFTAAWLFDARMLDYIQQHGFPLLRMAHLHVPRNLDLEGTRLTELAMRAEMSKQSIGEIVDQCTAMGLVERIPDKSDRRAKIVAFTPRGLRLMAIVRAALSFTESEMLGEIGARRMREVMTALTIYADAIPPRRKRDVTPRLGMASRSRRAALNPAR